MQNYEVLKSFNVFATGETVELDPEDDGTAALLRDDYVTPADDTGEDDKTPDE